MQEETEVKVIIVMIAASLMIAALKIVKLSQGNESIKPIIILILGFVPFVAAVTTTILSIFSRTYILSIIMTTAITTANAIALLITIEKGELLQDIIRAMTILVSILIYAAVGAVLAAILTAMVAHFVAGFEIVKLIVLAAILLYAAAGVGLVILIFV